MCIRDSTRTESGGEATKVDLVEKILVDLAKRFKGRPGGYTRIVKFGPRRGDNAPMSIIEFVGDKPETEHVPQTKGVKKAKAVETAAA